MKAKPERRIEICRRLADGETIKEIAWCMKISVKSVQYHLAVIRRQTGARTTLQAVLIRERGTIEDR